MRTFKEKIESDEWILEIGGFELPNSVLKSFLTIIMILVMVALAYNTGVNDALEYVKWTSYMTSTGVYNQETHSYMKCYPINSGNRVQWQCDMNYNQSNQFSRIEQDWMSNFTKYGSQAN
jgi:hypothetical protein